MWMCCSLCWWIVVGVWIVLNSMFWIHWVGVGVGGGVGGILDLGVRGR